MSKFRKIKTTSIIPKQILKSKTFKFEWDGQINFTSKGLSVLLSKVYKDYLKKLIIKEEK